MIDCNFGAGWDLDEHGKQIRPRKITSARLNKIAILTTEPPDSADRLVVGAFKIIKLVEDPGKETYIYGDKETMLDDMLTYKIRFWDHHKNPRSPLSKAWSVGLFRYVSDVAVFGILEEYVTKKRSNGGDTSKAAILINALKD